MNLITFLLLLLMFPYWFPVAVAFFIGIGVPWMIGYPIACTAHMLYVRVRYGRWTHWYLLYPGQ